MFSTGELLIIGVIAFLVFGPEKFPEFARTLGKLVRDIKRGIHSATSEVDAEFREMDKKQQADISSYLPEELKKNDSESGTGK